MDAAFGGLAAIRFERDQTRHSDRKGDEVVSGGHCSGAPALPMPSRMRFFILVADVHRRVAPIELSLE